MLMGVRLHEPKKDGCARSCVMIVRLGLTSLRLIRRLGVGGTGRDRTGRVLGSCRRRRRRRTRSRCKPRAPRITYRGHTASHARQVTHDKDTELGTRFPGWDSLTSDVKIGIFEEF